MPEHATPSGPAEVVAVVLTYDSPVALERCVRAVATQTRPPERILVIDNGGREPVDDLAQRFPSVEVHRNAENLGPAGGFAVGLERFRDGSPPDSWAWVLDDDCVPEPAALERLVDASQSDGSRFTAFPRVLDSATEQPVVGVGWWGVLVPHSAVVEAGVPVAELFWWIEDTEYLQWRLPRAGFDIRIARDAVVRVDRSRSTSAKPGWKYYYEARNTVYYRLHIQARPMRLTIEHARGLRIVLPKAVSVVARLIWRVVVVERSDRGAKLLMVGRGIVDGIRGRIGITVPVTTPDRPLLTSE